MHPHHAAHIISIDNAIERATKHLNMLNPIRNKRERQEAERDLEILKQVKIDYYKLLKLTNTKEPAKKDAHRA